MPPLSTEYQPTPNIVPGPPGGFTIQCDINGNFVAVDQTGVPRHVSFAQDWFTYMTDFASSQNNSLRKQPVFSHCLNGSLDWAQVGNVSGGGTGIVIGQFTGFNGFVIRSTTEAGGYCQSLIRRPWFVASRSCMISRVNTDRHASCAIGIAGANIGVALGYLGSAAPTGGGSDTNICMWVDNNGTTQPNPVITTRTLPVLSNSPNIDLAMLSDGQVIRAFAGDFRKGQTLTEIGSSDDFSNIPDNACSPCGWTRSAGTNQQIVASCFGMTELAP